jgi:hypothetical protein
MQRTVLVLITLVVLAGCGVFRPEPTPTNVPRPTATPTAAPRYYPTLDASTRQELLYRVPKPKNYFREVVLPDGAKYEMFGLMVVSSGKVDTLKAGPYDLDVVWVYERNQDTAYYPLVIGVWDGKTYTPYYVGYAGEKDRTAYLAYLKDKGILERGRKLFPSITDQSGGYVGLLKRIDWEQCGDNTYCLLGKYMQDTYGLDDEMVYQLMGLYPIPEGWALAWRWGAATEENSDPSFIKIDLPGGEE